MIKNKQYISIAELAGEFKVNKSLFLYYVEKGLLKPDTKVGGMYLFNRKQVIMIVKEIFLYKAIGLSLQEIKNKIK